jgi:hypothetical protein
VRFRAPLHLARVKTLGKSADKSLIQTCRAGKGINLIEILFKTSSAGL